MPGQFLLRGYFELNVAEFPRPLLAEGCHHFLVELNDRIGTGTAVDANNVNDRIEFAKQPERHDMSISHYL